MDFNRGFPFYSKCFLERDLKLSTMGASTLIGKKKKKKKIEKLVFTKSNEIILGMNTRKQIQNLFK